MKSDGEATTYWGKQTSGSEREREETEGESGGEATKYWRKQTSGSEREREEITTATSEVEMSSSGPDQVIPKLGKQIMIRSGSEREGDQEESTELESSSGREGISKGKQQTSGSEREKGKKKKNNNNKEEKKKDRRRGKLFAKSTAWLHEVRSLGMAMGFNPKPNQNVVLEVPEDVDVWEFVSIAHFADQKGYAIHNEKEMMKLMLKRFENMTVRKVERGEDEDDPPRSAAAGGTSDDEGGQPQGDSQRAAATTTTSSSSSRRRTSRRS